MSDVKKLITGIVLVAAGIGMFLSATGPLPIIGVILGVIGLAFIMFVLTAGWF